MMYIFSLGLENPNALGIDWLSNLLFVSSYIDTSGVIYAASLEGTYMTKIITGLDHVGTINYLNSAAKPGSLVVIN